MTQTTNVAREWSGNAIFRKEKHGYRFAVGLTLRQKTELSVSLLPPDVVIMTTKNIEKSVLSPQIAQKCLQLLILLAVHVTQHDKRSYSGPSSGAVNNLGGSFAPISPIEAVFRLYGLPDGLFTDQTRNGQEGLFLWPKRRPRKLLTLRGIKIGQDLDARLHFLQAIPEHGRSEIEFVVAKRSEIHATSRQ